MFSCQGRWRKSSCSCCSALGRLPQSRMALSLLPREAALTSGLWWILVAYLQPMLLSCPNKMDESFSIVCSFLAISTRFKTVAFKWPADRHGEPRCCESNGNAISIQVYSRRSQPVFRVLLVPPLASQKCSSYTIFSLVPGHSPMALLCVLEWVISYPMWWRPAPSITRTSITLSGCTGRQPQESRHIPIPFLYHLLCHVNRLRIRLRPPRLSLRRPLSRGIPEARFHLGARQASKT